MTDAPPQDVQPTSRRLKVGVAIVVLAVLAGLCVLAQLWSPDAGSVESWTVCQRAVTERLSAPASAEFETRSVLQVTDTQWRVEGQVRFGALLPISYTCTALRTNEGIRVATVAVQQP